MSDEGSAEVHDKRGSPATGMWPRIRSYEKTTVITKEQLEKLFGKSVLVRQIVYQLKKKGI